MGSSPLVPIPVFPLALDASFFLSPHSCSFPVVSLPFFTPLVRGWPCVLLIQALFLLLFKSLFHDFLFVVTTVHPLPIGIGEAVLPLSGLLARVIHFYWLSSRPLFERIIPTTLDLLSDSSQWKAPSLQHALLRPRRPTNMSGTSRVWEELLGASPKSQVNQGLGPSPDPDHAQGPAASQTHRVDQRSDGPSIASTIHDPQSDTRHLSDTLAAVLCHNAPPVASAAPSPASSAATSSPTMSFTSSVARLPSPWPASTEFPKAPTPLTFLTKTSTSSPPEMATFSCLMDRGRSHRGLRWRRCSRTKSRRPRLRN